MISAALQLAPADGEKDPFVANSLQISFTAAADKTGATDVLQKIKDQVPQPELSRAAAAIDPKLPKELGIPEPTSPDAAKPAEPKRPRRR